MKKVNNLLKRGRQSQKRSFCVPFSKFKEKEFEAECQKAKLQQNPRQRNSRVAQKKLTKCQVFLGQANGEHLCSMEPFRNLKVKRNPPRRVTSEAEKFLEKEILKRNSRNEPLGISRERILPSKRTHFAQNQRFWQKEA